MEMQNVDKNLPAVDELKTVLKESSENSLPKSSGFENSLPVPKSSSSEKLCSFKPTKANQVECKEVGHFHYGDRSFCKKHNRTVQALNCKKAYEEAEAQAKAEAVLKKVQDELEAVKAAAKADIAKADVVKAETAKKETTKKDSNIKKAIKEETKKAVKLGKSSKKTAKSSLKKPAVVKRKIKQNKWGRYEDSETGILFDPQTKAAFGVQDRKKGRILPLNKNAIDTCEKYGWKYVSIKAEEENSSSSEEDSESPELQPNVTEEETDSKSSSEDDASRSGSEESGSGSDDDESGSEDDASRSGSDSSRSGSGDDESGSEDDESGSGSGSGSDESGEDESGSVEDETSSGEDESGSGEETGSESGSGDEESSD
jgi:hypothetical protein